MSEEDDLAKAISTLNTDSPDYNMEALAEQGLTAPVIQRIVTLKQNQIKIDEVVEKYRAERMKLEKKFWLEYEKCYNERALILENGLNTDKTNDATSSNDDEEDNGDIPEFWLRSLLNHDDFTDWITEDDYDFFIAVKDIRIEFGEDMKSFKLTFLLRENDFCTNTELTKEYKGVDLLSSSSSTLEEIIGCEIKWKEGKNLCEKTVKKKQQSKQGKRKGETRTVKRIEPVKSFFHYFSEPIEPDERDDEEEEDPLEDLRGIKFDFDEDYELGTLLLHEIIPNAINWYTGEAVSDDEDEDGDDDDGADGDSENENGDDIESADDDNESGDLRDAEPAQMGTQEGDEKQPECKSS